MDITTFIQSADYFALIMIFASGYILLYTVFGKMREWKNFDGTIKVVLALVVAMGIEFGLILPLFYILPSNFNNTGLFLPAFSATWIYHWIFTGCIALAFTYIRNRELTLRCLNSLAVIGFIIFLILAYVFLILAIEYSIIYPSYILASNGTVSQLFILSVFDIIGVSFFILLIEFSGRAWEEEKIYGKANYSYFVKNRTNRSEKIISISSFLTKIYRLFTFRKKILLLVLTFLIIGLFIPVDSYAGIFSPKIHSEARVLDDMSLRSNEIDCAVTIIGNSFDEPSITTTFAQTRCDRYTIQPGLYDQFGSIKYAFEKKYENSTKSIRTTFEPANYDFNQMVVCIPYNLQKNITAKIDDKTPTSLMIDYSNWNKSAFNLTFCSWEPIDMNNKVDFTAEPIERTPYNGTHITWRVTFAVDNHSNENIHVKSLQYLYFNHQDIDQSSAKVYHNGQYLTYANRNFDTMNLFGMVDVQADSKSTITFEFIATNGYNY